MPTTRALVRSQTYVDSISLLQVTSELNGLAGVEEAAVVMATELNRGLLSASSLLVEDAVGARDNDLVIAVRAADDSAADVALSRARDLLAGRRPDGRQAAVEHFAPRSLRSAHRARPDAQLAVISVPGAYAAAEARQALLEGLHVFLFSDNVPLEDEVELKRMASQRGLLVMGPDCGTALLNGVGFGFANRVRRGNIGVVGASGTGIQEVTALVHQAGQGISHAIGTGSRDLHAAVGGATTLRAIDLLQKDPATEAIVLVAKPSDPSAAARVLHALAATGKRAVAYLQMTEVAAPTTVRMARNLEEAAFLAVGEAVPAYGSMRQGYGRVDRQGHVLGLFCGGTLREEAAMTLGEAVQHELIDFGDDVYTRGRAHPMIDPTLRNAAIARAGSDPRVSVLLLDFILGLGAHPDPAGAGMPAIRQALAAAAADGRALTVVAHVVGTDLDPQGLSGQEEALRSAGVQVLASNYRAALAACDVASGARA